MPGFARHLSDQSLAALQPHRTVLVAWSQRPRAAVHLRRGEALSFYLHGQRALQLRIPDGVPTPDALAAELDSQAARILANPSPTSELSLQAGLVSALRGSADFVVVDEQIQVPSAALADRRFAGLRVDLALLERATGDVWLVEVKPARSEDLDGPVLSQLARTRGLPTALQGGVSAFLETYRVVLAQKAKLGLLPPDLTLSGRVRTALVTLGEVEAARGRIACWPAVSWAGGLGWAHAGADEAIDGFVPLPDARTEALSLRRSPHAPRRPRWNCFTDNEDARQAAWDRRNPVSNKAERRARQLGPFHVELRRYLIDHGIREHSALEHLRSSQGACLQAFAPAKYVDAAPLTATLDRTVTHLSIDTIDAVDFEGPHHKCPLSCDLDVNMAKLVGEHTGNVVTGLDVLIAARGERDGRAVKILVGVEFKYTEAEFGACGGFKSKGNNEAGRRACVGLEGDRDQLCYLKVRHRREYLQRTPLLLQSPMSTTGSCLLLGPVNQLYRAHAVLHAYAADRGFDEVLYVVVADTRNPFLNARPLPLANERLEPALASYRSALKPQHADEVHEVAVQDLVAAYADAHPMAPWLVALQDRYGW